MGSELNNSIDRTGGLTENEINGIKLDPHLKDTFEQKLLGQKNKSKMETKIAGRGEREDLLGEVKIGVNPKQVTSIAEFTKLKGLINGDEVIGEISNVLGKHLNQEVYMNA